jgi:hypothetical protein
MLAPSYAQHLDHAERPELVALHRMLASVLRRRGVSV